MRIRIVCGAIALSMLTLGLVLTVSAGISGNLEPPGLPDSTYSYTLEDIYNRLNDGMEGAPSTFTEPSTVPGAGTMHTLDDIMDKAPVADNTNGVVPSEVLSGTSYWGLRTDGTWGLQNGTMSNNGAVVILPTTVSQTIAAGYHDGSGYVEGDADLAAGNIVSGAVIFGVTGVYTGPAHFAPVPKTGQTSSHAAGDDGDLQVGVPWPVPRFTANVDSSGDGDCDDSGETCDGTVTDNLTGLIWLHNANCFGTRSWPDALSGANTLNSGECGLSDDSREGDWRLPNIQELQSLVDYGSYSPALPSGHPFTGIPSQSWYYWSSTASAGLPSYAWTVGFRHGSVIGYHEDNAYCVWPVRGGQ